MLLKRPATIHLQDGLFVPDGVDMEEVDRRWELLCNNNPACFDGTLLHVLGAQRNGCGGANVHVMPCSYRFFAVQDETYDLGVRTLGVKGITEFDGAYLFGKRSQTVRHYAGEWEFAPAGCVPPEISPDKTIEKELLEETGLELASPPVAVAILFDEITKTWELVYRLRSSSNQLDGNDEYQALKWLEKTDFPTDMRTISAAMLPYVRSSTIPN
ncbi:MAG: NUDIX domain-containing protein [Planctomycetes bacterium]|nr:NUDIX domain-containing protein [Planctomycetota bacterium]MBL6997293.1 NUDIX domain-containing protein [Phycisphaerales bacterium]